MKKPTIRKKIELPKTSGDETALPPPAPANSLSSAPFPSAPPNTRPLEDALVPAWSREAEPVGSRRMWISAAWLALLALALRIPGLTTRSLWFDEIHTWNDAHWLPPGSNVHWLFFRITSVFTDVLGRNELGLRMFPLLTGIAGVALLTVWVWRIAGRRAGIMAGILLALSPLHIGFSQECRYYAPMVLYAVGALWCASEWFASRGTDRLGWLVGLGAALFLASTNHMTAGVMTAALGAWMIACLALSRWGRAWVTRLVMGSPSKGWRRPMMIIGIALVLVGWIAWKQWPGFHAHLKKLTWENHTPNVEWSVAFFETLAIRFGSGTRWSGVFGVAAGIIIEVAFLAGWGRLLCRRMAWGWMIPIVIGLTLLAVFSYPVTQAFDPKYIAFLVPVRLLGIATGLAWGLGWMEKRLVNRPQSKRLFPAAAGLTLAAAIYMPALATYYPRAHTPMRPAMMWLRENTPSDAPIVSYGHTNYGTWYYAERLDIPLSRLTLLRWPSGDGALDVGRLHQLVPPDGHLYFLAGWPHDLPDAIKKSLERNWTEVARFPSSQGKEYDGVVYRWKYGAATLRENRRIEWTAGGGVATGEAGPATLEIPPLDMPTSFYSIFDMDVTWTVEPAGARVLVDGEALPLEPVDATDQARARARLGPGLHEWSWIAPEPDSDPATSSPARPRRVALEPSAPLRMTLPPTEFRRVGHGGERVFEEYRGRPALRFLKNGWVEYEAALTAGRVYRCTLEGAEESDGPAVLSIGLNEAPVGLLLFFGEAKRWVERSFSFRARKETTRIRLRLISEFANAQGQTRPGHGVSIHRLTLDEVEETELTKAQRDDRMPPDEFRSPVPSAAMLYADPQALDRPAAEWQQSTPPGVFSVRLLKPLTEQPEINTREPERSLFSVRIHPPYHGSIMSPLFPVRPERVLCMRIPVETDEIYRIGSTLLLLIFDEKGEVIEHVFPSRGSLNDDLDWDFVYRPFEGRARRDLAWFFPVPTGAHSAALGVIAWPHPVPKVKPKMEIFLGEPYELWVKPDLLKEEDEDAQ